MMTQQRPVLRVDESLSAVGSQLECCLRCVVTELECLYSSSAPAGVSGGACLGVRAATAGVSYCSGKHSSTSSSSGVGYGGGAAVVFAFLAASALFSVAAMLQAAAEWTRAGGVLLCGGSGSGKNSCCSRF